MYARKVDGQLLTFRVSGLLWNSSLVMEDMETQSKWSHILGEAKDGPLKGTVLEQVPSVMTDWASWKEQHPDGTAAVMSLTTMDYTRQVYDNLSSYVLGVMIGGQAFAWRFDLLEQRGPINDELAGEPVVVAYHRPSRTPRLYHPEVKGRKLTFATSGERMSDAETKSLWDPVTGKALEGPLAGEYLKPYPAIVSFRDVWIGFHEGGRVFEPEAP